MINKWWPTASVAVFLVLGCSCSQSNRQEARRQTERAQRKAEKAADRASEEVKKLANEAKASVNASSKPFHQQLSHAALIAKIKSKLVNQVGLSTLTGVNVDARSKTVTLQGTVSSAEQKSRAEQVVRQMDGVASVDNLLQVKP